MAWGVVIGGALQLLSQVPSLLRLGFSFTPALDFSHPGLRNVLKLMGPAILGNASVQINVFINTKLCNRTHRRHRSRDQRARHLAEQCVPLHATSTGLVWGRHRIRHPAIHLAQRRFRQYARVPPHRATLSRTSHAVYYPFSRRVSSAGQSMIALVYQHGGFHLDDTQQTALALSCYALGLTGYSAVKILAPAFYALNDAKTPMLVSMVSIFINFATAFSLIHYFHLGIAGLALSTSVVALVNFLILFTLLRGRVGGLEGAALASSFFKIVLASLGLAAACASTDYWLLHILGTSLKVRLADLAVSITFGAAVFYTICRLLRVAELEDAREAIAGPLMRKLGLSKKPHANIAT